MLCKFEVVVKLDANNILIPSLVENAAKEQANFNQPFLFPPSDRQCTASNITRKKLLLRSNKSCYRRIFMAPHVPVSFWSRLIARCLSCNYFCQILVNYNTGITIERCPTPNKIVVDDELFQWHFSKKSISLLFGDHILLSVNNASDRLNQTVIKYFDSLEQETPVQCRYKDGFVIYVPNYTVLTVKDDSELHYNKTFSPQILVHVLELIDQIMRDHFEGLLEQGIYQDNFLLQLIPCPFCFGDKYPDAVEDIDQDDRHKGVLFCFSVRYCLEKQQELEDAMCYRIHSHNLLEIRHVAPDLVCT